MIDDEELLERNSIIGEPRQAELIKRHCGQIQEQIRKAGSHREARRAADAACRKFEGECDSRLLRNFLRQYACGLFDQRWNGAR